MTQRISILRGINVGGKRKILMPDLITMMKKLGFSDCRTYIQSGNMLFNYDQNVENSELELLIEKAILQTFEFDVPVMVRTKKDFLKLAEINPFYRDKSTDMDRLHVTFLKETPTQKFVAEIANIDFTPDSFQIIDNHVLLYCSGKYSDTKLTNQFFEKKLKVQATTRNWKTVLKLIELLEN
ncbi:MAG: DUF1697 domain-containing protein [Bacteroidales bacterium]|nr:DUF1697 domain-containing protein [Bacteroidales bacterium]